MNAQTLLNRAIEAMNQGFELDERDAELLKNALDSWITWPVSYRALAISIARAVVNGTYLPATKLVSKTHNLGMTNPRCGYVHFRGIHVEHYSYDDDEKEAAALARLERNCHELLEKGMLVTARSAISDLFEQAPSSTDWLSAMTTYYCFFEKDGRVAGLFNQLEKEGQLQVVREADGSTTYSYTNLDAYDSFHALQNAGWTAAVPHGYERFNSLMTQLAASDQEIAEKTQSEFTRLV